MYASTSLSLFTAHILSCIKCYTSQFFLNHQAKTILSNDRHTHIVESGSKIFSDGATCLPHKDVNHELR